jgi:uncharacterized protein
VATNQKRQPAPPPRDQEVFLVPLDNRRSLVYAPLRRVPILVASDGAVRGGAKLRAVLDGLPGPEDPVERDHDRLRPVAVTLFPTTACNLRCSYCYAAAGDRPAANMPMRVARRGIRFVARNAKRRKLKVFRVDYHGGGEPTVAWRIMTESFAYAQKLAARLGLSVAGSLTTNGVLSDAQIDWIASHLEGATVSMDGLPEIHDANRPTVLGQGSSQRVLHTMQRFDEGGFRYGIRLTLTAENVAALPASIEFLCRHSRVARIQVEPSYAMGRGCGPASPDSDAFLRAFREARWRAQSLGRELVYATARVDLLSNDFCGATRDNFALSPAGGVSACYEVFDERQQWASKFFYGAEAAGGGYAFDPRRLASLRRESVQHREWCRDCYARWHCGGDCYRKVLSETGEAEFRGTPRCHVTRELIKDELLRRIGESGGVVWVGAKARKFTTKEI